ncbi:MAG TPA: hypothetical protein VI455_11320 [Terriglobia bacterium]
MSKKLWIRVVGLLALYAWGLTAILLWASTTAPDATTKANVSILMFVSLVGAGLITLMWTVLSLVDTLDHSVRGQRASR